MIKGHGLWSCHHPGAGRLVSVVGGCERWPVFGTGCVQTVKLTPIPSVSVRVCLWSVGVMAGFNMSSDLQRPEHNIPVGTLAAVCTSWVSFMRSGVDRSQHRQCALLLPQPRMRLAVLVQAVNVEGIWGHSYTVHACLFNWASKSECCFKSPEL